MWSKVANNGIYEVSDSGQVRDSSNNKVLPQRIDKDGYSVVTFNRGGVSVEPVHRLVANAFLPNPYNLPSVNHKDENKQNNKVSNLEWCNAEYNNNYGTRTQRSAMSNKNPLLR